MNDTASNRKDPSPARPQLGSRPAQPDPTPHARAPRRRFLGRLLGAGGAAAAVSPGLGAEPAAPKGPCFSVGDFGATGGGSKLDTQALQAAIDACASAGGGTVVFPAGAYLSGTIILRSRVTLHLDAGATLLGSRNLEDYPAKVPATRSYTDNYTERSLIYAENIEQAGIAGRGVIDGQGAAFKGAYKVRPYLLRFISCRDIAVRDVTLKDSPMWVQHYLACEGVLIDGLRVVSTCNGNNDGLDIDGCQRVRIANCDIRSGDDAIVLKSTLERPCRHIAITNCLLSSDCNAFKLGTESNGGFEDIVLTNCALSNTGLAGIALELVDGGTLDRVSISNVTMHNVRGAIFVRLGNRARPFKEGMPPPGVGRLRQVSISNVHAVGANDIGCSITGLPGHAAENILLDNISITFAGGGKTEDAQKEVPELPANYPEYAMFGRLPAYGLYCRHLRGLRLSNVRLACAKPDARPSLVCDDVADLELSGWRPAVAATANPAILFKDVQDAFVHGCQAATGTGTYLRVEGKASSRIRLVANDLADADPRVGLGPGVGPSAVTLDGTALAPRQSG